MSTAFDSNGVVKFPVDGTPRSFRFTVGVADSKLRIWIEDCTTKEQWETKKLAIPDFVTLDTAIPQAKAKDYAVRILECLTPTNDVDKPTRSLSRPAADGSRVLCVGFTLQTLTFTTPLEYSFTLSSIKLEATDMLASRMRDLEATVTYLEEENAQLKLANTTLQASVEDEKSSRLSSEHSILELEERVERLTQRVATAQYLRATTASIASPSVKLVWKQDAATVDGLPVVEFHPDGRIQLLSAGVYEFTIALRSQTNAAGNIVSLTHGSSCLVSMDACSGNNNSLIWVPLHCVFVAAGGEELGVTYSYNTAASVGSYMTIMKH